MPEAMLARLGIRNNVEDWMRVCGSTLGKVSHHTASTPLPPEFRERVPAGPQRVEQKLEPADRVSVFLGGGSTSLSRYNHSLVHPDFSD